MTIPIEEIQLLDGCQTKKQFVERFSAAFGKKYLVSRLVYRTNYIWSNRVVHLKHIQDLKDAAASKTHTVMIPAQIKSKSNGTKDPAFTEDEIFVKIHNDLQMLIQLIKEQNDIIKKQVGAN